ncbi:uncharacterized protein G2W53_026688 [Senna tora]|uniref:Uncharacterized protein n=1 Tax=Senna tora TaxID=362788 RepID=A0A834TFH4_9FABA|nr:uncharacterized protein G2W53_026688 [Senna tora]
MPRPTRTCGKCNCGFKKRVSDMMASTKLLQFLMSLNPTFDVARTQILNLDPLPTVNKAFSMIVTDEAQREINMVYSGTGDASSAMLAKTNPGKNEGANFKRKDLSKKDTYCDHCNANGHTRETCFKIHGFPDWYKELKEKKGSMKPIAGMAKEQTASETGNGQEGELISKGDLTTVVNYLLKEVQRLGKGKVKSSASKEEQVNIANLYDFSGTHDGTPKDPLEFPVLTDDPEPAGVMRNGEQNTHLNEQENDDQNTESPPPAQTRIGTRNMKLCSWLFRFSALILSSFLYSINLLSGLMEDTTNYSVHYDCFHNLLISTCYQSVSIEGEKIQELVEISLKRISQILSSTVLQLEICGTRSKKDSGQAMLHRCTTFRGKPPP